MRGLAVFLLLVWLVPIIAGIWTVVDVSKFPETAFRQAQSNKTFWTVVPLMGVLICGVAALICAIVWGTSVKPRVIAASGRVGGPPPPPPYWN